MFQDLDKTLSNLLSDPAAPPELRAAAVTFFTPDNSFQTSLGNSQTAVNLFLHRIQENRELRDNVPFPEPNDPPNIRRQPLLRVDCSYLVTTWSQSTGEKEVIDEHQLLGEALQWLSRFPTIPTNYLSGSLNRSDFPLPVTMSAQLDPERVPVDFWTALGIAPRPSFDLTVTIAIDLGVATDAGQPVSDRELDLSLIPPGAQPDLVLRSIGGTVHNAASQPIANATVTIVNAALSQGATTDSQGHYLFKRLPPGLYQLSAVAPPGSGLSASPKMISVPRKQGDPDYDLVLS